MEYANFSLSTGQYGSCVVHMGEPDNDNSEEKTHTRDVKQLTCVTFDYPTEDSSNNAPFFSSIRKIDNASNVHKEQQSTYMFGTAPIARTPAAGQRCDWSSFNAFCSGQEWCKNCFP